MFPSPKTTILVLNSLTEVQEEKREEKGEEEKGYLDLLFLQILGLNY
jgi:hypothetical protein